MNGPVLLVDLVFNVLVGGGGFALGEEEIRFRRSPRLPFTSLLALAFVIVNFRRLRPCLSSFLSSTSVLSLFLGSLLRFNLEVFFFIIHWSIIQAIDGSGRI